MPAFFTCAAIVKRFQTAQVEDLCLTGGRQMRNWFKVAAFFGIFMAIAFFCFATPQEVKAETTVTYYFVNEEIPAGEQPLLVVNEDMMAIFRSNPALIGVFAQALSEKYSTDKAKIDVGTEINYLVGVLTGVVPGGIHIPAYLSDDSLKEAAKAAKAEKQSKMIVTTSAEEAAANAQALGMAGKTFVDINKSQQKLYYYVNGELVFETPIVTGNVKKGHTSPSGTFSVKGKARNRTLRGKGYASFVKYWVPIVNNIGIHDASWRSSFGGNIYKTNGSHGCINVPPANMPALYDALSVGTTVIVHD